MRAVSESLNDPGVGETRKQVDNEPGLKVGTHDLAPLHDENSLVIVPCVEVDEDVEKKAHVDYRFYDEDASLGINLEAHAKRDNDRLVDDHEKR